MVAILTLVCITVQNLRATSSSRKAVSVRQNARAAPKGTAKGGDVESIRSLTTCGELPSLSHRPELTHAVGSQAERTAAEASEIAKPMTQPSERWSSRVS